MTIKEAHVSDLMAELRAIPEASLVRLHTYYRVTRQALDEGQTTISSEEIAAASGNTAAQVRKDLSYVGQLGRPGIGYEVLPLAATLEEFLGLANDKEAVLVGAGRLGMALAAFSGFARYGLRIIALFDTDPAKAGWLVDDKPVFPLEKMADLVRRLHVQIGIITVPAEAAQQVANEMVAAGIIAIWNFAPCKLSLPDNILVYNEDLASRLATLAYYIRGRSLAARLQASKPANLAPQETADVSAATL